MKKIVITLMVMVAVTCIIDSVSHAEENYMTVSSNQLYDCEHFAAHISGDFTGFGTDEKYTLHYFFVGTEDDEVTTVVVACAMIDGVVADAARVYITEDSWDLTNTETAIKSLLTAMSQENFENIVVY